MPLPLRDYQVADLAFLINRQKSLMLHDPGGGKTPTVCVYFYYHWTHFKHRTCWVMPKSLTYKNQMELLRFTDFNPSDIKIVLKEEDLWCDAKVFLMTPTRFRMSWKILTPDVSVLAADEPHMYWTNNESQVTKALYECSRRTKFFVGMTGTLIKGRLNSCFPMIHVIEPNYYPSYQAFMNYHAVKDAWGNVLYWKNPERITEIIGRHAIRRSFESIYGAESKVIQTQLCEMSPKQRVAYKEFESKALLELDDSFLEGSTGGVFTLRCRQIMAHPETFGLSKGEATGKDEMLEVHLADHANSGKPLIIYAAFKAEQKRIVDLVTKAGLSVGLMNGDTSGVQRAKIDKGFREGTIQVLVGSPQVAAVGYNWQETAKGELDHIIFTTLDYGDDGREAIRRLLDMGFNAGIIPRQAQLTFV